MRDRNGGNYVKKNRIQKRQVWCVYNKDSFLTEHFNGVGERANSLNRINPELQECIEFWF